MRCQVIWAELDQVRPSQLGLSQAAELGWLGYTSWIGSWMRTWARANRWTQTKLDANTGQKQVSGAHRRKMLTAAGLGLPSVAFKKVEGKVSKVMADDVHLAANRKIVGKWGNAIRKVGVTGINHVHDEDRGWSQIVGCGGGSQSGWSA